MSDETKVATRESSIITRLKESIPTGKIFSESNKVVITGRIENEFEYCHEVMGNNYYRTRVIVERFSGTEDFVPIVVSDLLIKKYSIKKPIKGKFVEIVGQFRAYNRWGEDGRKHLELFLFVMAINIYEDRLKETVDANLIFLNGYLCKPPVYRVTPLGRRITDLLIAVNRPYGKSDYIPCIAWGINAKMASEFEVGDRLKLYGRIQSRRYFKRYSQDSEDGEYRDAYEISVTTIEKEEKLKTEV